MHRRKLRQDDSSKEYHMGTQDMESRKRQQLEQQWAWPRLTVEQDHVSPQGPPQEREREPETEGQIPEHGCEGECHGYHRSQSPFGRCEELCHRC